MHRNLCSWCSFKIQLRKKLANRNFLRAANVWWDKLSQWRFCSVWGILAQGRGNEGISYNFLSFHTQFLVVLPHKKFRLPVSRRVFICWYLGFEGMRRVRSCFKTEKNEKPELKKQNLKKSKSRKTNRKRDLKGFRRQNKLLRQR